MTDDVLLLDNNDSFTFNIVDMLRNIDNVTLRIVETDKVNLNEIKDYSKIIISPGPGLPSDFPNLFSIIEHVSGNIPILGICLGHQTIAEFLHAKLKQIVPVVHGQSCKINILKPSPLFDNIPSNFDIGLYHSWAIDSKSIPNNINVTAVSDKNIIMAIESIKLKLFGVQFHPESHLTQYGLQIINNFIHLDL